MYKSFNHQIGVQEIGTFTKTRFAFVFFKKKRQCALNSTIQILGVHDFAYKRTRTHMFKIDRKVKDLCVLQT